MAADWPVPAEAASGLLDDGGPAGCHEPLRFRIGPGRSLCLTKYSYVAKFNPRRAIVKSGFTTEAAGVLQDFRKHGLEYRL